jgi:hypothetical protein
VATFQAPGPGLPRAALLPLVDGHPLTLSLSPAFAGARGPLGEGRVWAPDQGAVMAAMSSTQKSQSTGVELFVGIMN